MTTSPRGKGEHFVHFCSPGFPGGSLVLLVTDKQEHEECKYDEDGADAAPERCPIELQPRSSGRLVDVLVVIGLLILISELSEWFGLGLAHIELDEGS